MKIGDKIKLIRETENHFKQGYVAYKIGLKLRSYQNIENNVSDLAFSRLEKIAAVLGVTSIYIINYRKNNKQEYNSESNIDKNIEPNILIYENEINTIHKMYAQMLALKDLIIQGKDDLIAKMNTPVV
jgi:transcriptional regulator with XRE-family HTH domain